MCVNSPRPTRLDSQERQRSQESDALSQELSNYFRDKRALVDAALRQALQPAPGLPASLLEAMAYSLLAPGKRLRPLLVLMACEAAGGTDTQALPAVCAV